MVWEWRSRLYSPTALVPSNGSTFNGIHGIEQGAALDQLLYVLEMEKA